MPTAPAIPEILRRIAAVQAKLDRPIRVLDIGGGHYPFAGATHIVDLITYEEFERIHAGRSYSKDGVWGGSVPKFSKGTWIIHDICSKNPLPFPDKYFDFCIASNILEDVINPFRASDEINRVSKAGYVEVPSKEIESTLKVEGGWLTRKYCGYYHHHWMFTIDDGDLVIEPKYAFYSSSYRFCFPGRFKKKWIEKGLDVLSLFWQGEIRMRTANVPVLFDMKAGQQEFIRARSGFNMSIFMYEHAFAPLRRMLQQF